MNFLFKQAILHLTKSHIMRFGSRSRLVPFFLLVFAYLDGVLATSTFSVTVAFGAGETFALGELASTIETCQGSSVSFAALSSKLQIECVHKLISQSAVCEENAGVVFCNIGGVSINIAGELSFGCGTSLNPVCPFVDPLLTGVLPSDAACAPQAVSGFVGSSCYASGFCLVKTEGSAVTEFGDFCPDSSSGEYCCMAGATRDGSVFDPGSGTGLGLGYVREIDYLADMSFKIDYVVLPPAQLTIKVEVPYVTSSSSMDHTEDGVTHTVPACPTTYLIDFTEPIESDPWSPSSRTPWLPLTHLPHADQVGQYRSSCSNADFGALSDEAAFVTNFKFPDEAGAGGLTYGNVPTPDESVWNSSQGTQTVGIPYGANTFWKLDTPVANRVNYTSGSYDLIKTYSKCKRYSDGTRLVNKIIEPEPMYINGVPYDVETYSWDMSICQVGFHGRDCRASNKPQTYAKTCAKVPVTFSISPLAVSHVTSTAADSDVVSKAYLQSVTSNSGTCSTGSENIVITINLLMMTTDYTIVTDSVHDLLEPQKILSEVHADQLNIDLQPDATFVSTAEFLKANPSVAPGVYYLKRQDISVGSVAIYSHKIVIVTKCYNTGFNAATKKRAYASAFATDVAVAGYIRLDLEVMISRQEGGKDVKNTMNLRILSKEETFTLTSIDEITQEAVTAKQELYGSYEVAKSDTSEASTDALSGSIKLFGGDQICSKHQVIGYDGQVANLIPNAVGACLLTATASANPLKGTTIKYRTPGMQEAAEYVFGCEVTGGGWIDVSTATYTEGVYVFNAPVTMTDNPIDQSFWFVLKEKMNSAFPFPSGENLSDRFGVGLMYYNGTEKTQNVFKSDQMQISSATRVSQLADASHMDAGCSNTAGNLKAACNLVCFDLVDGLLTNTQEDRAVLVHHVSVATLATEADSTAADKFSATSKRHRRLLLETVSPLVRSPLVRSLPDVESSGANKISSASLTVGSRTAHMDPLIHNATANDFHEAGVMGGILGTWLSIGVVVLMVFFITQCTDCCGGIAAVYKRRSSKKTQPEGGGKMYGNDLHRR
jgi:hypothetical protein